MKNNTCRLIILVLLFLGMACTQQMCAFSCGGDATIGDFPCGKKIINVTWKKDNLWILTRPLRTNDTLETYTFAESSSWDMMEGTVIIKECRQ
jgi:hypothetical protein